MIGSDHDDDGPLATANTQASLNRSYRDASYPRHGEAARSLGEHGQDSSFPAPHASAKVRAYAGHMPRKHGVAARRVLASLDAELAASGLARGEVLSWSAAEVEMRSMLATSIDRRTRIAALWEQSDDPKIIVKLSNELRQCDTAIMRLLKAIRTDVAGPESQMTLKNRRAANTRWDRERQRAHA